MLLFPFLKQVSTRGDTNSHGHPHFSLMAISLKAAFGESLNRALGANLGVCVIPHAHPQRLSLACFHRGTSLSRRIENAARRFDCGRVRGWERRPDEERRQKLRDLMAGLAREEESEGLQI